MMAQQQFAPPVMGPAHPGMPHHPMGMPHPGAGHMGGQPGPMMQGMHPGVSGPQVTQGPMVTGMPPGAGTPATMQNMSMAHMAPQQHMFQQQNPQMNLGQMQMNQQAVMARQKMLQMQQHNMAQMNMPNNPHFSQAQLQQMRMGMPMQQQQHMAAQMQANQQQAQFQQQQQHQQRLMAQQVAAQQAAFQRAQNQQAAQQMQLSRSQEPTTQAPQPHSTPAPQHQPAPPQSQPSQPQQAQPPVQAQPPQAQPKPQPQSQPQPPANNQQGTPQSQVKQDGADEEPQIKQQEIANQIMMQDIPKQQPNDFTGQCILQLLSYQDNIANPERPDDINYWEEIIQKYFSEYGSIRQQVYSHKKGEGKHYQLQYPSVARFYYLHFRNGVKQILMQSFDHSQSKLPNGGIHIQSAKATLTYVFKNDVRITTQGSLNVHFDEMQKIEFLHIATSGWTEYIPRNLLQPTSPEQQRMSPKMNKNQKKNQPKPQGNSTMVPSSPVGEYGLPTAIMQFFEIVEVLTTMGPIMDFFHAHPGTGPREAMMRINVENHHQQQQHQQQQQLHMARAQQNANVMAMNGQVPFQNQRAMAAMQMPNALQSPAMQHLGLPQGQNSPHMGGPNHTPSPAHNLQGGIAMVHQMSAQGSNLSGSQGPSTNTSPNVSNKKRRQSTVKMEEENQSGDGNGPNRVKPSPQMKKRQKGQ